MALACCCPAMPAAQAAPTPVAPLSESAAMARAVKDRVPVEVSALTGERRQVVANPGGTFTETLTPTPVRVKKGSTWVDVDPSLSRAGGRLVPKAVPVGVSLADGGAGELGTLTEQGRSISMSWPDRLPAPVLRGNRAIYADVRPGIDLVVKANQDGFGQFLVVRTRQAAQDPWLREYRLPVSAPGLTVVKDGFSVRANDAAGQRVFASEPIQMWGSTGVVPTSPVEAAAYATGSMLPGRTVDVDFSVADGSIVMRPDRALLDDPATQFPVVIDPSFSYATASDYAFIDSIGHEYHSMTSNEHPPWVGFEKAAGLRYGGVVARLFYSFQIAPEVKAAGSSRVISAKLVHSQTNAPHLHTCSQTVDNDHDINLWRVHDFDDDDDWDDQPSTIDYVSKSDPATVTPDVKKCNEPARDQTWSATSAVKSHIDGGDDRLSFRINAEDDTDTSVSPESRDEGVRYYDNTPNRPKLVIEFNAPPNRPGLTQVVKGSVCATTPGDFVGTLTPTFCAMVSDPNPTDNLTPTFVLTGVSPVSANVILRGGAVVTTPGPAGKWASFTVPAGQLVNGATYRVFASARDQDNLKSETDGPARTFTVDTTAPGQPVVTGPSRVAVGASVSFVADAPEPDVAAYYWAVDGTVFSQFVTPATLGGPQSIPYTASVAGTHTLYVQSQDRAGNPSPTPRAFTFTVA